MPTSQGAGEASSSFEEEALASEWEWRVVLDCSFQSLLTGVAFSIDLGDDRAGFPFSLGRKSQTQVSGTHGLKIEAVMPLSALEE